ncbi:MAG: hypothetical protein WCW36_01380 [Candidatus Paceibacterota bacterium]|jgi:hypothetical protein
MNNQDKSAKLAILLADNSEDLKVLGLLFLRLLEADMCGGSRPSATLAFVMTLDQKGNLGLNKELPVLLQELLETELSLLSVGGESILKLG